MKKENPKIESFPPLADLALDYIYIYIFFFYIYIWPCQLGQQNTLTRSLQQGKIAPYECPGYDTKQSDGEVPVMMELWGMWSTPSLPSLPGPHWPAMVAPDRVLSMGQIEITSVITLN